MVQQITSIVTPPVDLYSQAIKNKYANMTKLRILTAFEETVATKKHAIAN